MQGIKYSVDMVICIDATGSMSPVIEKVKEGAKAFNDDLSKIMSEKGKLIDDLRIRIIAYRDFYVDGEVPLEESNFFSLPKEKLDFSNFVSKIEAYGGGDEPENGLEAVALAMKSDWSQSGNRRRQVIVVWTDASSHKLEKSQEVKSPNYPDGIAKNFDELTDWWESGKFMNDTTKRLVLFTPDAYPWTDMANNWNQTVHFSSKAGDGLSEIDYKEILNFIANSI